jgi:hypothetical protein
VANPLSGLGTTIAETRFWPLYRKLLLKFTTAPCFIRRRFFSHVNAVPTESRKSHFVVLRYRYPAAFLANELKDCIALASSL